MSRPFIAGHSYERVKLRNVDCTIIAFVIAVHFLKCMTSEIIIDDLNARVEKKQDNDMLNTGSHDVCSEKDSFIGTQGILAS